MLIRAVLTVVFTLNGVFGIATAHDINPQKKRSEFSFKSMSIHATEYEFGNN